MNGKAWTRVGGVAAAFVVLTGAARDSVPDYYSHTEYYSDSSRTTQVGGWLSCPPEEGGYSFWGERTGWSISTYNDYEACMMAE